MHWYKIDNACLDCDCHARLSLGNRRGKHNTTLSDKEIGKVINCNIDRLRSRVHGATGQFDHTVTIRIIDTELVII